MLCLPQLLQNELVAILNFALFVLKSKGDQFFSYTYVSDAVAAMLHVMLNGITGVAYNISSEKCNVHLKDFASLCAYKAGKNVVFEIPSEIEKKGFSIASAAIMSNTSLLQTGFVPKYEIRESINRTIEILK